jgi:pectin methylesterase-like acyl-CoA thioesterase
MQFHTAKVTIAAMAAALCTLAASAQFYPANGTKDAPYDAQLVLTFDDEPELMPGSFVTISDASGKAVDKIAFTDDTQTFSDNIPIAVGSQLVRKDGKAIYIIPHFGKILPASSYAVSIDATAIKGTLAGKAFAGIDAKSWSFSTKTAPAAPADGATIAVDNTASSDNKADFHSVMGALAFLADKTGTYTITLAPGTYYELIRYSGTANIILQGPKGNNRGDNVTIEYVNCNDMNASMPTRPMIYFTGADLSLENLTLVNLTDRKKSYISTMKFPSGDAQAETIYFNEPAHHFNAYNCTFKSHQDTLLTKGKVWFYNCAIQGDVDFNWGYCSAALFENCDVTCLFDSGTGKDRAYLFETRVGKKGDPLVGKGYVLYNSHVIVEKAQTAYYGRRATAKTKPTDYYDQCAIVNVEFSGEGNMGDSRWYVGKEPDFIDDSANVGWKEYNVTFKTLTGKKPEDKDVSKRYKNSASIDKKVYKTEYSTRDQIMNRSYNIDKKSYQADANIWDINQLARDRGYDVKDLPKNNPNAK